MSFEVILYCVFLYLGVLRRMFDGVFLVVWGCLVCKKVEKHGGYLVSGSLVGGCFFDVVVVGGGVGECLPQVSKCSIEILGIENYGKAPSCLILQMLKCMPQEVSSKRRDEIFPKVQIPGPNIHTSPSQCPARPFIQNKSAKLPATISFLAPTNAFQNIFKEGKQTHFS